MGESTTIPVTKATRKRLKKWKTDPELTYDEAINHLIDNHETVGDTSSDEQIETDSDGGFNCPVCPKTHESEAAALEAHNFGTEK